MKLFLAVLCLGSLAIAQVAPPERPIPEPSVDLPAELQRVLTDFEKAWMAKDAEGLANLFVEDGFVLPNGGPPVRGRADLAKHYASSGSPLALRAIHFETDGNTGFILGGFSGKPGGPDSGKFTLTLRKVGGRWLVVSDMDNPNQRSR